MMADDGGELTVEEDHEFTSVCNYLEHQHYHTGPLPATAYNWDFNFEGWQEDNLDTHRHGVKIHGCVGFPRRLHWMQKASWLFILMQAVNLHALNLPLLPYPGNVVATGLVTLGLSWLVVSNVACCLTQSADPAVFGTKRWSKKEYLLWLRIKYQTRTDQFGAGQIVLDTVGRPTERALSEFRRPDGSLQPDMERKVAAHPRSQQVREAIPVMDWQERCEAALAVARGDRNDPVYPKRRWDKWDKVMVLHGSYHDHTTNKAIKGMDHFCKWLNSSIGDANYHWFQSFALCCFWLSVFHFGVALFQIVDSSLDENWYRVRIESVYPESDSYEALVVVRIFLCIALVLSMAVVGQLGFLYGFHFMLFRLGDGRGSVGCRGRTTIQYWNTVGELGEKGEQTRAATEQAQAQQQQPHRPDEEVPHQHDHVPTM